MNVAVEVKAMEVKKTEQLAGNASVKETAAARKRARDYIAEIKSEIKKISWTSPEELKAYTKIVVGATFVCGLGLYVMDLAIQTALYVLESALRVFIG